MQSRDPISSEYVPHIRQKKVIEVNFDFFVKENAKW